LAQVGPTKRKSLRMMGGLRGGRGFYGHTGVGQYGQTAILRVRDPVNSPNASITRYDRSTA